MKLVIYLTNLYLNDLYFLTNTINSFSFNLIFNKIILYNIFFNECEMKKKGKLILGKIE
jgi:hypothetical protein